MKTPFQIFVCLCFAALLVTKLSAESEPNNESAKANQIEVGKEFSFQISPLHDADYFKMKSPGDGVLKLELTKKLTKHGSVYPWWGEEADENGRKKEVRPGLWNIRVKKDQEVILAIRSNLHSFNAITNDEEIFAKVTFTPELSPHEPNDSMPAAEPIEVGKEFSFQINPIHEMDYFKMKAPGNGVLKLELTKKLTQHSSIYPWWGEVKNEKGANEEVRSGLWNTRVEKDQDVFLAIRSNLHSFNAVSNDEVIHAKVTFTPEHSPHEPNDSMTTAEPIEIGKEFSFQLNPIHEMDYFKMKAPGNGVLKLELTKKLTQHPSIYPWWGEVKNEKGVNEEVRSGLWDARVAKDQDVFLAIRSNSHSFNAVSNDEVIHAKVTFTPEHSPGEPNDSMATAETIEAGKEFSFQLNPIHDVDYFKLKSPSNGVLKLELASKLEQHSSIYPWWGESKDEKGARHEIRPGLWDVHAKKDEVIFLAIRSNLHSFNAVSNNEVIRAKISFSADSQGEPNDTPEQARDVKLNDPFEVTLMPTGDRDYLKFLSPGNGLIVVERIDKKDIHKGLFPSWIEGETARNGVWETRVKKDDEALLVLRSNQYGFNESSSPEAMLLRASFLAEPENLERGDDRLSAETVKIGEPFKFAILPRWDRDIFKFIPDQDGYVKLGFDESSKKHSYGYQWVHEKNSEEPSRDEIFPVKAGETYFLELGSFSGSWQSAEVLGATIINSEPPPKPEKTVRRWSFPINRNATSE